MKKLFVFSAVALLGTGIFASPADAACAFWRCGYCVRGGGSNAARPPGAQAAQAVQQVGAKKLQPVSLDNPRFRPGEVNVNKKNKTAREKAGLQVVTFSTPHFDPGEVSVNKKNKNAKEKQGLRPIDINTVAPGAAPR
jgi:hypothetical protein